ncbi:polysaccharide biosynthesis tyrosine autokinase [Aliifodinibius salicampi]|uniref:non-specific protein-tyrosine kinase n=1 Tax=Fodinibius salicampi TaxID=1920655 RepID=A0ABT3PV12_9BACT|nr:polysaccharide biosynthesis tyrosine autokinase [Fodinibius salicampi]MCW9711701.1 polysaccharide biosynthesis tyrosine autokinase [Fodinibius salicampi]
MASHDFIQNNGSSSNGTSFKKSISQKANIAQQELIDFKRLFSLISRYKWVFLLCIIIFASGAYAYVNYYLAPIYKSSATVLIENTESNLPGSESEIGQIVSSSFSIGRGQNVVQNAIYLFQSKELSNRVAEKVLQFDEQPNGKRYPIFWTNYPEDSTMVSSATVASRIRSGLKVERSEQGSSLLVVSYESYSPYETAQIVNFAVNEYQNLSLAKKKKSASNAHEFLAEKKEELKEALDRSEQQLSQFTGSQDLVALESQASNAVNSLSELEAERQSIQIQLESTNTAIENYENKIESIKPGLSDQYSKAIGPQIASYQQQLAQLTTRRFILLSNNPRLKENPDSEPELKKLNEQIEELRSEIESLSAEMLGEDGQYIGFVGENSGNMAQELGNIQRQLMELRMQKSQFEAQISALDRRIEQSRGFLDRVPDNRVQLARLERTVEMNRELYTSISQQEAEIGLWEQTQSSNATIFDHATVNMSPVKPQKTIWYLGSILLGFLLPLAIILAKDYFTSVINSSEKLKSYPYPLLSVIYHYSLLESRGWNFSKKKGSEKGVSEDLVMYHDTTSPIAESYRRMVGNLLYGNPDHIPKTLLITSSGAGEGKTTLTANLGWALAEIGKKVLIIDCDFRRPNSHKMFNLSVSPGLTELVYDESTAEKAIRSTKMTDLYVLPAGKKPIQPAKLTSSSKFKELVKKLKEEYDIVLFDTPPYGIVSDITPIIGMSDQIIVAAKFNETKDVVLKNTLEDLNRGYDENNIGLVLTMYKPKKSSDSYETKGLYQYRYQEYYDYAKTN